MMDFLIEPVRKFVTAMNEKGIPLPMLRVNGKASFTATMTFISFNTALLGQIGKVTKVIGEVDLTQANYLFLICLGAYLGRRMQRSEKGAVELSGSEEAEGSKDGK